jgi:hypothetical protein
MTVTGASMTDSRDGAEVHPEDQKIIETYRAYKNGGYQGLLELMHKRNEEAAQDELDQDQRLTDALREDGEL